MDLGLEGKSVLVTGASRGIGRAVAQAMAAEGCNLHLAARNGAMLEALADELVQRHGIRAEAHARDLSITAEVEALGSACRDVDILVNNAGDIPTGTLQDLDAEAWRRGWQLKVFGYVDLTRAMLPAMYARGSGVIVNINGVMGQIPTPRYIAGCMGNAALDMLTHVLGGESIRHGVRVVAVNPGPTMSDRHKAHVMERARLQLGDESRWPELERQFPSGRSSTVEEVADAVTWLASDRARHISGASLRVDGAVWAARGR